MSGAGGSIGGAGRRGKGDIEEVGDGSHMGEIGHAAVAGLILIGHTAVAGTASGFTPLPPLPSLVIEGKGTEILEYYTTISQKYFSAQLIFDFVNPLMGKESPNINYII